MCTVDEVERRRWRFDRQGRAGPGRTAHLSDEVRVVSFREVRTEVMPLEVGEEVSDDEGVARREEPGRSAGCPASIPDDRWHRRVRNEERARRREQVVEGIPFGRVVDRLHVCHAPIAVDRQVLDVATRTADLREQNAAERRLLRRLADGRLEVVQEVELHEIDDAHGDFVRDPVEVAVRRRREHDGAPSMKSSVPSRTAPEGVVTGPVCAAIESMSGALHAHLGVERADQEFANRGRRRPEQRRAGCEDRR